MRVLILGSGAREHALVAGIAKDPAVDFVACGPGNPGIGEVAELHEVDLLKPQSAVTLAQKLSSDLVIVGPEAPLVAGVADALRNANIACFGPSKTAARLESSKDFAKQVMATAKVPTAKSRTCDTLTEVTQALGEFGPPYVVKDDALAAGKGVVVTTDRDVALAHAANCAKVVIEEYLAGPEVSLFVITDGHTALPLLPAQDFKRIGDNDTGPNTGGMGAYCPLPWLPKGFVEVVLETVVQPTLAQMRTRGTPFAGLLYCGLIITANGPKVIEFNARFGDPETQPVLALLESPLAGLLHSAATGTLAEHPPLRWKNGAAVTIVLASAGYPATSHSGDVITGADDSPNEIFHAGTARRADGALITAGGRVLSVTGTGPDLAHARDAAYRRANTISFEGQQVRTDIAAKAIAGEIVIEQ